MNSNLVPETQDAPPRGSARFVPFLVIFVAAVAYYNLLVAAIATIPVAITGIVAWQWELEGQKLKGTLLMHLVMGCVSTALILAVWFIHRRTRPNLEETLPGYRLPIEAVAVFIVALTGHLGGFLSGVNGPG